MRFNSTNISINPDTFFGVYSIEKQTNTKFYLNQISGVFASYPNKISQPEPAIQNFCVLDLPSLQKGVILPIYGQAPVFANPPILLSGGVIEIYQNSVRDHILLTLRDTGKEPTQNQYTTVAGRANGNDLHKEILREQAEESPFLLKNTKGQLFLGIKSLDQEYISYLESSISDFIKKIQSTPRDSALFLQAEKYLKISFPKIAPIDNLIQELKIIQQDKRYITYDYQSLGSYPGMESLIKTIHLGETSGSFFAFHDIDNNTLEYRSIELITGIPKNFELAGRGTSRLYLESIFQRPRTLTDRTTNIALTPTVAEIHKILQKTN